MFIFCLGVLARAFSVGFMVACSFRCVWNYVLLILAAVLCTSVWGFAIMMFMVGADECFAVLMFGYIYFQIGIAVIWGTV